MAKVQINKKKYVSKYHETVDLAVDAWYNLITTNAQYRETETKRLLQQAGEGKMLFS